MAYSVMGATSSLPGFSALWSAMGTGDARLEQLADDLQRLATQEPASLACALRDLLMASDPAPGSVAGVVAPRMNDTVLDALGQFPLGREVVRMVHTVYATTSCAQRDVVDRLGAAVAAFAGDAMDAGQNVARTILGDCLGKPLPMQLLAQGRPHGERERRARPEDRHTVPAPTNGDTGKAGPGDPLNAIASGFLHGLDALGDGLEGAVADVDKGVSEATVGVCTNLLQGRIGEACASSVRGTDHAILQSTERACMGVREGAQSVCDGATDAAGPAGRPVRWVTDRMFDIGNTLSGTAFGMVRDLFRIVPNALTAFVSGLERAVKLAIAGDWGRAAAQFGMAFVNALGRAGGSVFAMLVRAAQGIASIAQTIVGAEPPARKLSPDERAYLERIYGDSIDYDAIRVKPGGPLNDLMAAHTVGNIVYMPSQSFNPDGSLTDEGLQTLGHEAGHVWQNQNGGGDYIANALFAQFMAFLGTGDRGNAYDWRQALADGQTFETMNDEQRARVMEDIGVALQEDGEISAGEAAYGDDYSPQEIAFLQAVAEDVRAGEGAG